MAFYTPVRPITLSNIDDNMEAIVKGAGRPLADLLISEDCPLLGILNSMGCCCVCAGSSMFIGTDPLS